jgi:SAM-dependent methyltransferase
MFTCNITGNKFDLDNSEKNREGGLRFGYNSRFRAICYVLSKMLFGEVNVLSNLEVNKNIKGIGMSDDTWANICEEKFNYINTFYHCEPFLDIYNNDHVNKYQELDFVISSDVFEHINPYPGLQIAFNNLYKMLKNEGVLVFSVPYYGNELIEHFPNLYDYKIVYENNKHILYNTTKDGNKEIFDNLCFHGGPGSVLEMRVFSKNSVETFLLNSGFTDIKFYEVDSDMNNYGIFWENDCRYIISAKKLVVET